MSAGEFTQRFAVDAADIDELGHVNNVVYLRYAQDIAIAHWRARASPEMLAAYVWVVARHEVDYRAPLAPGAEALVRTTVEPSPRGAAWTRFVDVYKAGEARPAVQIKSNWCLLDAKSRRLRRVPQEVVARFQD